VFQIFESVASTTVARRSTEKEEGWLTLSCSKQATVLRDRRLCDGHHIAKTIIRVSGWGLYGRIPNGGDSRGVDHEEDISIRQKKDYTKEKCA
jgi:hypothetical protein